MRLGSQLAVITDFGIGLIRRTLYNYVSGKTGDSDSECSLRKFGNCFVIFPINVFVIIIIWNLIAMDW